MGGNLSGVELKIERAKKHLRDLEAMWRGFLDTDPYEFVPENHSDTGKPVIVVRRAEPLPPCLAPIVGDVVHNLRASLDHLIPQLILANGGKPDYETTEFPIGKSQASYESMKARKVDGISNAASQFMDALKPYKGGNDALWSIKHLDIVDKHRLVVTVAASHGLKVTREHWIKVIAEDGSVPSVRKVEASPDQPAIYVPRDMPTLEVGMWFTHEQHFEPIPEIALDEPGIGEREPLLPTLHDLVGLTERVVGGFAQGEPWGAAAAENIGVLIPTGIEHLDESPIDAYAEWRRLG